MGDSLGGFSKSCPCETIAHQPGHSLAGVLKTSRHVVGL